MIAADFIRSLMLIAIALLFYLKLLSLFRLSEKWRPFRTWAVVLIRVAGDRASVPWQAEPNRRKPAH